MMPGALPEKLSALSGVVNQTHRPLKRLMNNFNLMVELINMDSPIKTNCHPFDDKGQEGEFFPMIVKNLAGDPHLCPHSKSTLKPARPSLQRR
jgi:hypothetical protein